MISSNITEIEIYDHDNSQVVAKINIIDECTVQVETKSIHTIETWKELSKEIEAAIEKMNLI